MTESKYRPEMCAEMIKLATEGKYMVQIAAHFKIDKKTLWDWSKDTRKPEFMEAYKIARTCSEAYMAEQGQRGFKGLLAKFNAPAWIFSMKCMFKDDWTETSTQKIELKNEIKAMSNEEIDDTIKTLLAQRSINKLNKDNNQDSQETH